MGWLQDLLLDTFTGHYALSTGVVERSVPLATGDVVVDLGGGNGGVAARLAARVRRVIVVEPDGRLVRDGTRRHANVAFVVGDGRHLPLVDGAADHVLIIEVLHHVDDAQAVLSEAARVVRRGGTILVEETEFTGVWGALRRWFERIVTGRPIWPRSREQLGRLLASARLEGEAREAEGFVLVARTQAGRDAAATPY